MPRELIAQSQTPDGESLTLTKEDAHHVVRIRGELLMSSRLTGSEESLAALAFEHIPLVSKPKILVGGLGLGFTLRAILNTFSLEAEVTVVELFEEVVNWNRGVLAGYAQHALEDPRVTVVLRDLVDYLQPETRTFDAIVLDIDNGPEAFTVAANNRLYSEAGLTTLFNSLSPEGVMLLWSAFKSSGFEKKLNAAGFAANKVAVRARAKKGARHTVFLGVRSK